MNRRLPLRFGYWLRAAIAATLLGAPAALRADIGYQFVTVGNPGNAADTVTQTDGTSGYGQVNYTYDIGKYDVTLNQYTTFLNAVAQTDPFGLYNPNLATNPNIAGINQTGSSGSYQYAVIGDGQRPITYVSWLDAARFSNWMQNGQPTGLGEVAGSTEEGAYTLDGDTTNGRETKNANASFWIPTENECYKAAYYDPNKGGLGIGGYWQYATKSDTTPGNLVGSGVNQANYQAGTAQHLLFSVTQSGTYSSTQNYLTDVGEFTNSVSAYGTYDQTGDVYNWNDSIILSPGLNRGLRGGSWDNVLPALLSDNRAYRIPSTSDNLSGFRLASVPEPTVAVRLIFASGLLLARRKRPAAL